MKISLSGFSELYRRYRSFSKNNKTYKAANYLVIGVAVAYSVLLLFPQILFANQISHKNFNVYSRTPLNENVIRVLDSADERLLRSPIYRRDLTENVLLTDSFAFYKFLTLKSGSLGSTIPVVGHSRINKSDVDNDLVFRDTDPPNRRSLSGVIAHETMHNQIRAYLGELKYFRLPAWKDEGYCEYTAGETTLSFDEGVRLWKENPNDSSKYDYFKYHQIVKYLLDDEKIAVEDLLKNDFDTKELEAKVFSKICQN